MEVIGFACGAMGFILALSALERIRRLERKLIETGILKPDAGQSR
jgi:hypothetical protein